MDLFETVFRLVSIALIGVYECRASDSDYGYRCSDEKAFNEENALNDECLALRWYGKIPTSRKVFFQGTDSEAKLAADQNCCFEFERECVRHKVIKERCSTTDQSVLTNRARKNYHDVAITCGLPPDKLEKFCENVKRNRRLLKEINETKKCFFQLMTIINATTNTKIRPLPYVECTPEPDHIQPLPLNLGPDCSETAFQMLSGVRQCIQNKWQTDNLLSIVSEDKRVDASLCCGFAEESDVFTQTYKKNCKYDAQWLSKRNKTDLYRAYGCEEAWPIEECDPLDSGDDCAGSGHRIDLQFYLVSSLLMISLLGF